MIDLRPHLRSGAGVWWSQTSAEPTPLVHALLDQVGDIGPVRAFVGLTWDKRIGSALPPEVSVVSYGGLGELRHLTRTTVAAQTRAPADRLRDLDGVHDLDLSGLRANFEVDTARLDDVLAVLGSAGVESLTMTPPTLEELFLRHYGDDIAGDSGDVGADAERELA